MASEVVHFRDWTFEVDKSFTEQTYSGVTLSGADSCLCSDCKNYSAYREKVFPEEVRKLLADLGIDYRKEVEVNSYEILPNGLHHVGGWFHFKGRLLKGKDYRVPLPGGGHTFDLTQVADNFSIGFAETADLAFFEDKSCLVQVEFDTAIPWVIDQRFESGD